MPPAPVVHGSELRPEGGRLPRPCLHVISLHHDLSAEWKRRREIGSNLRPCPNRNLGLAPQQDP